MDEFSFIDMIKQNVYKQSSLIKGIGDDAAVFRSPFDIVTAVDTFVENVHFSRQTMAPFHVGYRALAANISDLAAMGAIPAFYLVSIVIPSKWEQGELLEIFSGMKRLADYYKMDLIGGDTVSGNELTLSITVIGYAQKNKARYRTSAQPGDIVFVTGTLGDSQAGFHLLTESDHEYLHVDYFVKRHRMPEPRVAFATGLANLSRVALNDISDGIASESNEIAQASHVSIMIEEEKLPVSRHYNQFPEGLQHQWKLYGGEDFELLGTVKEANWSEIERIAERTNTKVTKIGMVLTEEKNGSVWLKQNDKYNLMEKKGYNHLADRKV